MLWEIGCLEIMGFCEICGIELLVKVVMYYCESMLECCLFKV